MPLRPSVHGLEVSTCDNDSVRLRPRELWRALCMYMYEYRCICTFSLRRLRRLQWLDGILVDIYVQYEYHRYHNSYSSLIILTRIRVLDRFEYSTGTSGAIHKQLKKILLVLSSLSRYSIMMLHGITTGAVTFWSVLWLLSYTRNTLLVLLTPASRIATENVSEGKNSRDVFLEVSSFLFISEFALAYRVDHTARQEKSDILKNSQSHISYRSATTTTE